MMMTRLKRKALADQHADGDKKVKRSNTATLQEYYTAMAPHNLLDDLSSVPLGTFPATCLLSQSAGIDGNNFFALNGYAYARDQLCKWIKEFYDKSTMPTCPTTRREIPADQLALLGFELGQFKAYRMRQQQRQPRTAQQLQQQQQQQQHAEPIMPVETPLPPPVLIDIRISDSVAEASDMEIATSLYHAIDVGLISKEECMQLAHLQPFLQHRRDEITTLALQSANGLLLELVLETTATPHVFPWSTVLGYLFGTLLFTGAAPIEGSTTANLLRACRVPYRRVGGSDADMDCAIGLLQTRLAATTTSTRNQLCADYKPILHAIFTGRVCYNAMFYDAVQTITNTILAKLYHGDNRSALAEILDSQLLLALFRHAVTHNSTIIFDSLLRLHHEQCRVFTLDEIKQTLLFCARNDRLGMLLKLESIIDVGLVNEAFLDDLLLAAVKCFANGVALALHTRKNGDDNIGSFRALQHIAIQVGNAAFLQATFHEIFPRLLPESRANLLECAVNTGLQPVIDAVLRPDYVADVQQWCGLLNAVPQRGYMALYKAVWLLGARRFLINIPESELRRIALLALDSLLTHLRNSNVYAARLWMQSMPKDFFENQLHHMLTEACQPDSEDARQAFDSVVAEHAKRFVGRPIAYFFNGGALLRRAATIGSKYVVAAVCASVRAAGFDAEHAEMFRLALGLAAQHRHLQIFAYLLDTVRDCGRRDVIALEFRNHLDHVLGEIDGGHALRNMLARD